MAKQTKTLGPRKLAHVTDFLVAVKGVPLGVVKSLLTGAIHGARFTETSKYALACRYATGKLAMGGALESQRFHRLNIVEFGAECRSHFDANRVDKSRQATL